MTLPKKENLFLLLLLPLLVMSLVMILRQPAFEPDSVKYAEVARKWSGLPYTEIQDTPSFRARLEGINITQHCVVSDIQVGELFNAFYDFLISLRTGSYDNYRRFRTPIPAEFNEEMLEYQKEVYAALMPVEAEIPNDSEDFFRAYYSRVNQGRGLTNFWMTVALGEIEIEEASDGSRTNLPDFAVAQDNRGWYRPNPTFRFDETPEKIRQRGESFLQATISFVTEHRPPDPPWVSHTRFYWSAKHQKWIPWQYVSGYSGKRSAELVW